MICRGQPHFIFWHHRAFYYTKRLNIIDRLNRSSEGRDPKNCKKWRRLQWRPGVESPHKVDSLLMGQKLWDSDCKGLPRKYCIVFSSLFIRATTQENVACPINKSWDSALLIWNTCGMDYMLVQSVSCLWGCMGVCAPPVVCSSLVLTMHYLHSMAVFNSLLIKRIFILFAVFSASGLQMHFLAELLLLPVLCDFDC